MYASAFSEAKFLEVKFEFERTHLEETYGISYFKLRATLQTTADNLKWEFYVQGSWVLEKDGDRWLIRHEHFSPILGVDRVKPLDPIPEEPKKEGDGKGGPGT
ncbi:MAG: nuclear transport factor 2 family protein [Deltaproteobacteria bacterium]|nr:nuclear transport factor 2 family protein [Deltaproteobacteria bacterium]